MTELSYPTFCWTCACARDTGWLVPSIDTEMLGLTRNRERFTTHGVIAYTDEAGTECVHVARRSKLVIDHPGHENPIKPRRFDPAI